MYFGETTWNIMHLKCQGSLAKNNHEATKKLCENEFLSTASILSTLVPIKLVYVTSCNKDICKMPIKLVLICYIFEKLKRTIL